MAQSPDTPAPADAAPATGEVPGEFNIKKLYLKDVSFESPGAPQVFTNQWQPKVDLQLHSEARRFSTADYEVTVTATVTVKAGDDLTAYLAEVQVAGVFGITGLDEEALKPVLGSYCPSILFPYLREVVSDLSVRGGFPQLVLQPVNFDALYQRHLEQQDTTTPV